MRAEAVTELFEVSQGRTARLHELADVYRDEIPLDQILSNPYQPRVDINPERWDFAELCNSIRNHGLLQPIVVTPSVAEEGNFTLIAGERRWLAVRQLAREGSGATSIAATVVRLKDAKTRDADMLCKALTENVVRSNLETSEVATAVATLREISGWTLDEVAERLGLSVTRVSDLSAIAKHEPVLQAIREGTITQLQARAIGYGVDSADEAEELVGKVSGKDLKTTDRMVKALKQQNAPAADRAKPEIRVVTPPPQIDVDKLPISRLVGGGLTPREEVHVALDRTCLALGYWPERPQGK